MALLLIRTTDTCDYVHADDPAAKAPEGAEGWVPKAKTGANGEATTITIRPLNGFEQLECHAAAATDGATDQSAMVRAVLERGLVAIDGDPAQVTAFMGSPSPEYLMSVFTLIMNGGASPFPGDRSDS